MTISAINLPQAAASPTSTSKSASSATDGLVSEQTFLQLLVAQLQNQDPTQPQDGTQFVAQLAQFSSLEQEIQMRQDLDTLAGAATANPTGGIQTTPQP
jgi:flagellar basal-body rod modification protein FlgD